MTNTSNRTYYTKSSSLHQYLCCIIENLEVLEHRNKLVVILYGNMQGNDGRMKTFCNFDI
jgi:hypothetical protein